ncbi:hypothetical protein FSP39_004772 [Pinctada imbricata]|uniref:Ribosomal protein eL8/eL30/eS12/Gadd45 domain-containing protein n=1 Tax=Pinctada imbricata TaxID=66713 RepID=A0AA88YDS9_PINIB|nr:hypothetical protein FSP39_004772 [Pinctada imbricata]
MVSKAKSSKRRRRRQEMLQKAADEELAEISLEQQMLRELNLKPKQKGFGKEAQTPGILKVNQQPQASGKKSKQAVSLDLSAMIDALEKKKTDVPKKSTDQKVGKKRITSKTEEKQPGLGHNLLDSSAPTKRGKERENPKPKKPSSLKKVILKEREEKKKLKLLDDSESHNSGSLGLGIVCGNESDLSQDGMSIKSMNEYSCVGTPASNDLSPISQTSPISMSPLSPGVSPQSSEVNSPIAGIIGKEVRMKIHSRRFREYCNQVLNKDIDNCCTELLKDLVRFQDRMYHKDPTKAKSKRRIVLGLREVTKHLKLRKIKCVIISPNLEKIQSKGGLDDALNNILNLCNEQNTPFVFALGRRALGRACAKLVPVSVVGIFNYEGSNENFTRLMELSEQARQSYKEMVSVIEKEIRDYPTLGAAAAVPHIYAHMGHSRTPSGASVLSFTSSILSEPISENYPHSEPETDSKGYEIVKEDSSIDNLNKVAHLKMRGVGMQELKSKMIYPSVNVDIDDGNEADTEEYEQRRRNGQGRLPSTEDYSRDEDSEGSSEEGSDTVKALPHIDSIHSSMQELNTEILSQNSGRTYECDAISTHSSRTLGDGSSTILADAGERSRHDTPKSAGSPSSTLQRGKVIDAERIQNWVHQTQSRLENLQQSQEDSDDSSDTGSDSDTNDNVEDIDTNSEHIKPHSDGQSQSNTSQDEQSNKGVGSHHSVKHKESDLDSTARGAQLDNTSSAYSTNTSTSRQESVQNHLPSIEEGSELTESEVSLEHKTTSVDVEEVEIAINT